MPRTVVSSAAQNVAASPRTAGGQTKKSATSLASKGKRADGAKKTVASTVSKPSKSVRKKAVLNAVTARSSTRVLPEPSLEEGKVVWPQLPQIRGKGTLTSKQITAAVMRAIAAVNAKHAARTAEASDDLPN